MRWKTMLAGTLLLAALGPAAPAQEAGGDAPRPSEEAVLRLDELDVELEDFIAEWREEQMEIRRKAQEEAEKAAAEGREVSMPALSMRPDFGPFLERLLGWADESSGEDQALYLTKAVSLGGLADDSPGRAAFDRLLADHAASPSWARLGRMFGSFGWSLSEERAAEVLDLLAKSPDGDVRGWVVLTRKQDTLESAELDSDEYRVSKAAVLTAAAEASDAMLKDQLQGLIDLREKLGVGCVAPDIAGVDLDGVAFKLSDYKGKIVFLDFWGDW